MNPRTIREAQGWPVPRMVKFIGASRRCIERWETGRCPMPRSAVMVYEMLERGELPERYTLAPETVSG